MASPGGLNAAHLAHHPNLNPASQQFGVRNCSPRFARARDAPYELLGIPWGASGVNDQTMDYLMATNVAMIAVFLLLAVVWLTIRVGNAAIVLCHSATAFVQSLVVGAAVAISSTWTGIVGYLTASQPVPPPVVDDRRVDVTVGIFAGDTRSRRRGSATPMPTTFSDKSDDCQRGSAMPTPPSSLTAIPSTSRQSTTPLTKTRNRQRGRKQPGTLRKRAVKARLNPLLADVRTQRMTVAEIRLVVATFRRWMEDCHLAGRRIAVDDVWIEAQNLARAKSIPLPKRDRFLEVLARTPGVTREYDVRLDGETKTTVYNFSAAAHRAVQTSSRTSSAGRQPFQS